MDFGLSDEQKLLKDSVESLLADRYGFEARKGYAQERTGYSRAMWMQYAELGLLALPFEEKYGGIGGSAVDTMLVMEAFGRALVIEPYLATVVLCGSLLRLGGNAKQRDTYLPKIASGEMTMAFAHSEPQARYTLSDVKTMARKDGDGYILDGAKTLVLHGDSADMFVVSARVNGAQRDTAGLALFIIDANTNGITRRGYTTTDGQRAAELTLSNIRISADAALGKPGDAFPLIEKIIDVAIAAQCAEAVGAMSVMHEMTVDYLKTRKQFGVPIGNFQVLQHRAAEMLIALEQARSMAMLAAITAEDDDAAARRKAISAAKVQICNSGRLVGQQATQLHGGIGMTMEYAVGHYFKRVTAIAATFGDAAHHLDVLARAG
jgi:pimeloyl-CoA dehydrogenase small subunit